MSSDVSSFDTRVGRNSKLELWYVVYISICEGKMVIISTNRYPFGNISFFMDELLAKQERILAPEDT